MIPFVVHDAVYGTNMLEPKLMKDPYDQLSLSAAAPKCCAARSTQAPARQSNPDGHVLAHRGPASSPPPSGTGGGPPPSPWPPPSSPPPSSPASRASASRGGATSLSAASDQPG